MAGQVDLTHIAAWRLRQQRLIGDPLPSAAEAVRWLLAVQAQDYAGATWALAQRTHAEQTSAQVDEQFNAGAILRTHVMRPTWHFVLPEDAGWLLQLSGPRLRLGLRGRHRQLELSDPEIARATNAIAEALADGRALTRAELASVLRTAGIAPDGQRLPHLLLCAELDAAIISGPLRGKQFTWMAFEHRAPKTAALDPDAACVRLVCRYLHSHGPARVEDVTWWSGLTARQVRRALAAAETAVTPLDVAGTTYWIASSSLEPADRPPESGAAHHAHLLSNWDEYTVGYRDRAAITAAADLAHVARLPFGSVLSNVVIVDGRVRGGWTRHVTRQAIDVVVQPFSPLSAAEVDAVAAAARRFGQFVGQPVQLRSLPPSAPAG